MARINADRQILASQLEQFGVVNIGAVGTFAVQKDVSESTLRAVIAKNCHSNAQSLHTTV